MSTASIEEAAISGYLFRKTTKNKWQKKYYETHGSVLSTYNSHNPDESVLAVLELSTIDEIRKLPDEFDTEFPGLLFSMTYMNKTHTFRATSSEIADTWVDVLTKLHEKTIISNGVSISSPIEKEYDEVPSGTDGMLSSEGNSKADFTASGADEIIDNIIHTSNDTENIAHESPITSTGASESEVVNKQINDFELTLESELIRPPPVPLLSSTSNFEPFVHQDEQSSLVSSLPKIDETVNVSTEVLENPSTQEEQHVGGAAATTVPVQSVSELPSQQEDQQEDQSSSLPNKGTSEVPDEIISVPASFSATVETPHDQPAIAEEMRSPPVLPSVDDVEVAVTASPVADESKEESQPQDKQDDKSSTLAISSEGINNLSDDFVPTSASAEPVNARSATDEELQLSSVLSPLRDAEVEVAIVPVAAASVVEPPVKEEDQSSTLVVSTGSDEASAASTLAPSFESAPAPESAAVHIPVPPPAPESAAVSLPACPQSLKKAPTTRLQRQATIKEESKSTKTKVVKVGSKEIVVGERISLLDKVEIQPTTELEELKKNISEKVSLSASAKKRQSILNLLSRKIVSTKVAGKLLHATKSELEAFYENVFEENALEESQEMSEENREAVNASDELEYEMQGVSVSDGEEDQYENIDAESSEITALNSEPVQLADIVGVETEQAVTNESMAESIDTASEQALPDSLVSDSSPTRKKAVTFNVESEGPTDSDQVLAEPVKVDTSKPVQYSIDRKECASILEVYGAFRMPSLLKLKGALCKPDVFFTTNKPETAETTDRESESTRLSIKRKSFLIGPTTKLSEKCEIFGITSPSVFTGEYMSKKLSNKYFKSNVYVWIDPVKRSLHWCKYASDFLMQGNSKYILLNPKAKTEAPFGDEKGAMKSFEVEENKIKIRLSTNKVLKLTLLEGDEPIERRVSDWADVIKILSVK